MSRTHRYLLHVRASAKILIRPSLVTLQDGDVFFFFPPPLFDTHKCAVFFFFSSLLRFFYFYFQMFGGDVLNAIPNPVASKEQVFF